eukprot:NODE_183_length_1146_cov_1.525904_g180_i0.p1 GENE.NODE_183_length_1146_cov_1.525904_g180_i0~~NODE_183_length_1146_cov_1.525904_g180_i0.p1  ORF type:complete len:155 (+),score=22.41 NODE_183_length_1146_cov_1.525904_g180_i0:557-1021(+)
MKERLGPMLEPYKGRGDRLVPILQMVQEELGYLPDEAMIEIADTTGLPESRVYAVASFYAQFRYTPMGEHKVMVCRGTACHVQGAARILDEVERRLGIQDGETSEDLKYTLETVACIGCCGLAPTIVIDDTTYGSLSSKEIPKIFNKIEDENNE